MSYYVPDEDGDHNVGMTLLTETRCWATGDCKGVKIVRTEDEKCVRWACPRCGGGYALEEKHG